MAVFNPPLPLKSQKIKDIKLRVPEEYLEPIKEHAKSKGMSVNQLVISLLEKDMGMDIVTIREQNKGCDCIISWNFKHIVNIKTIRGVRAITNLKGYKYIEILNPSVLLESEG